MWKLRFVAIFFLCCIASGSCWKREFIGANCYIRNTQRSSELVQVTSILRRYKPALWNYGDNPPGSEAQWKINKWIDDNGNQFYEIRNADTGHYMTINGFEPTVLESNLNSFSGKGIHQNLFKIEGPEGSQTITSKIGGYYLTVAADETTSIIILTNYLNLETRFYKWRILCA